MAPRSARRAMCDLTAWDAPPARDLAQKITLRAILWGIGVIWACAYGSGVMHLSFSQKCGAMRRVRSRRRV